MAAITDKHVKKALEAYESLPPLSGREARMKAALEAVTRRPKPADPPPDADAG